MQLLWVTTMEDFMTKENEVSAEDIHSHAQSLAGMTQLGALLSQGIVTEDQVNAHINLYVDIADLKNLLIQAASTQETLTVLGGLSNQDNDPNLVQEFARRRESVQSQLQSLELAKEALAAKAVSNLPDFGLDGFLSNEFAITEFMESADIACDIVPLHPQTMKQMDKASDLNHAITHLQNCRLAPDDEPEAMPIILSAPKEESSVQAPGMRV